MEGRVGARALTLASMRAAGADSQQPAVYGTVGGMLASWCSTVLLVSKHNARGPSAQTLN